MTALRIAINAQVSPDGRSGGSVQGVLSLVNALSHLNDGDEEYCAVATTDTVEWLSGFLGPRAKPFPHPRNVWSRWYRLPDSIRRSLRPILKPIWNRIGPTVGASTVFAPLASDAFFNSLKVDLVHFPDQRLCKVQEPTVFSPWDLLHEHFPGFFSRADLAYRQSFYPAACHYADAVVVPTGWGKGDIERCYGLSPSKVFVIPLGAATEMYAFPSRADQDALRRSLNLPNVFALYPAQLWHHKNHLRLLDAVALLRTKRNLQVKIVCPGHKGESWPQVARRVAELGLEDLVSFPGYISHSTMRTLYSMAQFVILPTLFEGWGFPLFEAFKEGVAVACSNVTCLPELAGGAALLFDPTNVESIAEAIRTIATDEDLRRSLGALGRNRVRQFAWEQSAKRHRALYRLIAGRTLADEDRILLSSQGEHRVA